MQTCKLRPFSLIVLLSSAAFAITQGSIGTAYAASEIQVNVLAFAQSDQSISFESWREVELTKPQVPLRPIDFDEGFEPGISNLGSTLTSRMHQIAAKMERAGYRILFRQSWTQALTTSDQAPSIILRGGRELQEDEHKPSDLSAAPVPSKTDYMESSRISGAMDESKNPATTEESLDVERQSELDGNVRVYVNNDATMLSAYFWFHQLPITQKPLISVMDAQIRVEEGKLYYLDNPRFGLIVELGSGVAADLDAPEDSPQEDENGELEHEATQEEAGVQ
ncbi:Hypothetical protein HDN1F_12920 [gamma proteobacterium HdN1]|nr:Hypothetical protein HDN1F_12920 [gamma proteobacterium HdN1]